MEIEKNVSLKSHNTLQVATTAANFVTITTLDEFIELTKSDLWAQTDNKLMLGGGSNILLTDTFFDGLVVKNEIVGKELITQDEQTATIRVGAGENWNEFVRWAIKHDYRGIENLVSIPGTVGAAPMQNIGAYGREVEQFITRVTGHDWLVHKTKHMPHSECCFGYRTSLFKQSLKGRFFISHVTFRLHKFDPATYAPEIGYGSIQKELSAKNIKEDELTPQVLADLIAEVRRSKLPDREKIGTAGSFFQNPIVTKKKYKQLQAENPDIHGYEIETTPPQPSLISETPEADQTQNKQTKAARERRQGAYKLSAGQLIELAGYKGYRDGDVGTYDKHALVVVNHGNGTGPELLSLVAEIQQSVQEKFGVNLQPEVTIR